MDWHDIFLLVVLVFTVLIYLRQSGLARGLGALNSNSEDFYDELQKLKAEVEELREMLEPHELEDLEYHSLPSPEPEPVRPTKPYPY